MAAASSLRMLIYERAPKANIAPSTRPNGARMRKEDQKMGISPRPSPGMAPARRRLLLAARRHSGKNMAKSTCKKPKEEGEPFHRSAQRPRIPLPTASRTSQIPKIKPIDSSLPKKATSSSRINRLCVTAKPKPMSTKPRCRDLFSPGSCHVIGSSHPECAARFIRLRARGRADKRAPTSLDCIVQPNHPTRS